MLIFFVITKFFIRQNQKQLANLNDFFYYLKENHPRYFHVFILI